MTGSRSARYPNSHAHLRMSPAATALSGPNRQSLEGGSRRNDYGVRGSSLSRGPRSVHRRPVAPVRPGPEPGSVHHRRPPTAVPKRDAGGGVRLDGRRCWYSWCARGGVPDQVRLRGRLAAPRRAEDPAHAAGLFFITPALDNLDVAFRGLNTWHSFSTRPTA